MLRPETLKRLVAEAKAELKADASDLYGGDHQNVAEYLYWRDVREGRFPEPKSDEEFTETIKEITRAIR